METIEQERIDLYKELGCYEALKYHERAIKFENYSNEWKDFETIGDLEKYLDKEFGAFCKKGWFGVKIKTKSIWGHIHRLDSYRQKIPMSALLKLKAARESGCFTQFAIIDPDLRAVNCDPFLIGFRENRRYASLGIDRFGDDDTPVSLICYWLEKK